VASTLVYDKFLKLFPMSFTSCKACYRKEFHHLLAPNLHFFVDSTPVREAEDTSLSRQSGSYS